MQDPSTSTPCGRPKDPQLEPRALAATLEVYARLGWSGFTFGKVAELAHVGKSSLYSRWPTKMDLLLAALDESDAFYQRSSKTVEGLPFAEQMRRMIIHRLRMYFAPAGLAVIRVQLEYHTDPASMDEIFRRSVGRAILRTRAIIEAAIRAGNLVQETSLVHLADALEGAMLMHAIATPVHLRQRAIDQLEDYAAQMAERTLGPWLTERALSECAYCTLMSGVEVPAPTLTGLTDSL